MDQISKNKLIWKGKISNKFHYLICQCLSNLKQRRAASQMYAHCVASNLMFISHSAHDSVPSCFSEHSTPYQIIISPPWVVTSKLLARWWKFLTPLFNLITEYFVMIANGGIIFIKSPPPLITNSKIGIRQACRMLDICCPGLYPGVLLRPICHPTSWNNLKAWEKINSRECSSSRLETKNSLTEDRNFFYTIPSNLKNKTYMDLAEQKITNTFFINYQSLTILSTKHAVEFLAKQQQPRITCSKYLSDRK